MSDASVKMHASEKRVVDRRILSVPYLMFKSLASHDTGLLFAPLTLTVLIILFAEIS